jgi:hypothetical protein
MKHVVVLCLATVAAMGCKSAKERPVEPQAKTSSAANTASAGFVVIPAADNRVWVFREGSKELEEFRKQGEIAKHVTRPGAGPGGVTVKAPDRETIIEYAVARDGFVTFVRDERVWVFRPGSKDLAEFQKSGEPAKSVTRIGAGPMGMTVKAPDGETIDAYVAAARGA